MNYGIRHAEVDDMMVEISRAARLRGQLEGIAFCIAVAILVLATTMQSVGP